MAQHFQPQYEFHYQRVELIKTESLGIGSYGAVCKAMCDDLPCAAKILHPALFQFTAPQSTSVMRKFEQECHLLSAIKHPHIVQYLGIYNDPEFKLPVLLMELMDESLTQFLERFCEPLPYHTEVNFCHHIALALSYLHSNGIVHRDISSNNVLLIAGSRAKVTDFGMVKLYNVNHSTAHLTSLTQCPGTTVYMSPEALKDRPVYTDKLDCFSFGVLCVQIMTRQFPDPGDRFQVMAINDPRIPSGRVQVEVPEIKRRQSHIDMIDPTHPVLSVALDCLKDRDRERPSCHELCGRISTLKAAPKYTESMQHLQVNVKPTQTADKERELQQSQQIQELQQQLHTLHDQLHTLYTKDNQQQGMEQENQQHILGLQTLLTTEDQQLADKDHQLQQKEAAMAAHQQEIQELRQQQHTLHDQLYTQTDLLLTKDDQLQELEQENQQQWQQILGLQALLTTIDEQLAGKDHQLKQEEAVMAAYQQEIQQLRQQLESSEQMAAGFQGNLPERARMIQDLQKQVLELQQQLSQIAGLRREEGKGEASGTGASGGSIKLRWRDGGRAPRKMWGEVSAVDGSVVYFQGYTGRENEVFRYTLATDKWSELLKCPNYGFSLAMVNSLLTAIGGKTPNREVTNSLLSLNDDEWTKRLPPMPTKRWLTAVVCSGRSLVVVGGSTGFKKPKLSTVEVMDTDPTVVHSQQPPTPTLPSISNTVWRPGLHAGR